MNNIPSFRAFHIEDKTMHEVLAINFADDLISIEKDEVKDFNAMEGYSFKNIWLSASKFFLMQSTGLKDKNKQAIFDGDILECNGYKWVVSWCKKGSWLMHDTAKDGFKRSAYLYDNSTHKDIIIGNIHQHPELLGESR